MAWLLLLLGTSAGVVGFLTLGIARLAIDKIESLLLFLIAAVLITGGAVVRAVDRSRVVELQAAIRGGDRRRADRGRDLEGIGGRPGAATAVAPEVSVAEDIWADDEEPVRRPRRLVNVLGAAFLAVAVGLLGLWLAVTTGK